MLKITDNKKNLKKNKDKMIAYFCSESMQPEIVGKLLKYLKKHSKSRTQYSAKISPPSPQMEVK